MKSREGIFKKLNTFVRLYGGEAAVLFRDVNGRCCAYQSHKDLIQKLPQLFSLEDDVLGPHNFGDTTTKALSDPLLSTGTVSHDTTSSSEPHDTQILPPFALASGHAHRRHLF